MMHEFEQLAVLGRDFFETGFQRDQATLILTSVVLRRMTQEFLTYEFAQVTPVAISAAMVLHQLRARDRHHPGTGAGAGAVLFALHPGAGQGLLRQFISEVRVRRFAQHGGADQMVAVLDDQGESILVVVGLGRGHPGIDFFAGRHGGMIACVAQLPRVIDLVAAAVTVTLPKTRRSR